MIYQISFLNPTIQRAGHHTARVKSHSGLKKRQWTILNDADFATYLHMLLYIYVFFVYCDEGDRCESERFNKFGSLDTYSLFAPKCLFVAKYSSCFLHIIHICYLLQYTQIHRLDTLYYDLKPVELENLFKFWNKIFKKKINLERAGVWLHL